MFVTTVPIKIILISPVHPITCLAIGAIRRALSAAIAPDTPRIINKGAKLRYKCEQSII